MLAIEETEGRLEVADWGPDYGRVKAALLGKDLVLLLGLEDAMLALYIVAPTRTWQ